MGLQCYDSADIENSTIPQCSVIECNQFSKTDNVYNGTQYPSLMRGLIGVQLSLRVCREMTTTGTSSRCPILVK